MSKQFNRPNFGKGNSLQAINCMGIISFSETHINYKIESRLIQMQLLMFPPRGRQWGIRHLKTRLDSQPISKCLVSNILWWVILFVRTSRENIKCQNHVLDVLSYSNMLWFWAVKSPWYPPFLVGGYWWVNWYWRFLKERKYVDGNYCMVLETTTIAF